MGSSGHSHWGAEDPCGTAGTAFVAGTPVGVYGGLRAERKGKLRPSTVRASAGAPERPSTDDDESGYQFGTRMNLERLLHIEMVPMKSKRADCACIWCNGSKMRRCSWCDGRGYRQEFVQKSWEELTMDIEEMQSGQAKPMEEMPKIDVQCSACSGSKQLRCAYCRGSGIGSYGHAY